jgi:hypothetical protein
LAKSKVAMGQQNVKNKVLFNLLSESDSEFIYAKKIFLVKKASHFYDINYIKPMLNSIDLDSSNFNILQGRIDSINVLDKTWKFKSRKLKIFSNDKKVDKLLSNQIKVKNSKARYAKYIRLGVGPILYWNNYYLISYWLEYGGLSRRGKVAILKMNNNEFEVLEIYRLPGGS